MLTPHWPAEKAGPETGIAEVTAVDEEQPALGVEYDQPHCTALNDRQAIIGQRH